MEGERLQKMREAGVKAQPRREGNRDQGGRDKEWRKIGSKGPDRNRNPARGGREVGLRPERGVVSNETPVEQRGVEEGATAAQTERRGRERTLDRAQGGEQGASKEGGGAPSSRQAGQGSRPAPL